MRWCLLLLPALVIGSERFSTGVHADMAMRGVSIQFFPTSKIFVQGVGYYNQNNEMKSYSAGGRLGLRFYPDSWLRPYGGCGMDWEGLTITGDRVPLLTYSEQRRRGIVILGVSVSPFHFLAKKRGIVRQLSDLSVEIETNLLYAPEWYEGCGWCWDFYNGSLSFPMPGISLHYSF